MGLLHHGPRSLTRPCDGCGCLLQGYRADYGDSGDRGLGSWRRSTSYSNPRNSYYTFLPPRPSYRRDYGPGHGGSGYRY